MTSIGEAVYADAQERMRIDINLRAEDHGWGIYECSGSENGFYQLCKDDEVAIFVDDDEAWLHVWRKARDNPIGLEAEALGWLKHNCQQEYDLIASVASGVES